MKSETYTGFIIRDDGAIPIVFIGGCKLNLVSLIYKWHTKTDKVEDGANLCIVDTSPLPIKPVSIVEQNTSPQGLIDFLLYFSAVLLLRVPLKEAGATYAVALALAVTTSPE